MIAEPCAEETPAVIVFRNKKPRKYGFTGAFRNMKRKNQTTVQVFPLCISSLIGIAGDFSVTSAICS